MSIGSIAEALRYVDEIARLTAELEAIRKRAEQAESIAANMREVLWTLRKRIESGDQVGSIEIEMINAELRRYPQ